MECEPPVIDEPIIIDSPQKVIESPKKASITVKKPRTRCPHCYKMYVDIDAHIEKNHKPKPEPESTNIQLNIPHDTMFKPTAYFAERVGDQWHRDQTAYEQTHRDDDQQETELTKADKAEIKQMIKADPTLIHLNNCETHEQFMHAKSAHLGQQMLEKKKMILYKVYRAIIQRLETMPKLNDKLKGLSGSMETNRDEIAQKLCDILSQNTWFTMFLQNISNDYIQLAFLTMWPFMLSKIGMDQAKLEQTLVDAVQKAIDTQKNSE